MKLIKINTDHYIIVDNSEIKEGDYLYSFSNNKVVVAYKLTDLYVHSKKITHSTQPESLGMGWMQSVLPLLLSEVKEQIGEVDVEKKADKMFPNPYVVMEGLDITPAYKEGYVVGYNQALEDNKEKKYTEEDICKALSWGYHTAKDEANGIRSSGYGTRFIQSIQPKTEWEVEIVDGKLKLM